MKKRNWIVLLIIIILAAGTIFFVPKLRRGKNPGEVTRVIRPAFGDIILAVSTTGTVEPQNRLEIKPTMNGRVEKILVREGDLVNGGQTLALMSSTERAALLDAARLQDKKTLLYWEEAYKPSPLIAPISGRVIVRAVEPGQSVTTATVVLVLSDRLIVKAQVDETDIGKVKLGQPALISLDAYPEKAVKARVDHIAYESELVSNVTIYEVDILPGRVPPVFRSGMSANVDIIQQRRDHVLTLPRAAVRENSGEDYVMLLPEGSDQPRRRRVKTGISDGARVEIVSGLTPDDRVAVTSRAYSPGAGSRKEGNPFTPWGRKKKR